jgi:two-component system cell cycle sensor histidine kinase/response regulator CckA
METSSDTRTILIVDDEESVRTLLRRILERSGYSVLEAEDGHQGLEVYKENVELIDVLLLDLTMPKMSGYDMLAEIQIVDPDVKAIVVTGYLPEEERLVGVADIIRKPIQFSVICEAIARVLDD